MDCPLISDAGCACSLFQFGACLFALVETSVLLFMSVGIKYCNWQVGSIDRSAPSYRAVYAMFNVLYLAK